MLLDGPRSVAELADDLPVSRPAVSQHLKVLLEADLVRVTQVGTRRVYSANPEGIARLREWVEAMWEVAMGQLAEFARREKEKHVLAPLVKTIRVVGEPEEVFALFTLRLGEWWPLASHSVAGEEAVDARVEPGVGGRVYEVARDGTEREWGRVLVWEPGQRVSFSWHPGLSQGEATRVEVEFRAAARGTEVTLTHRGWEARGEQAEEWRADYDQGWDHVLAQMARAAAGDSAGAGSHPAN